MDSNEPESNVVYYHNDGSCGDKLPWHFIERYEGTYFTELREFMQAVLGAGNTSVIIFVCCWPI